MLQQTWLALPLQEDSVETTLGSRTGDGLADLLFSLVFADVLRVVRSEMHEVASLKIPCQEEMRGAICGVQTQGPTQTIGFS